MVGVTFNNKHSYDDYGLILSSKAIAPATPKTITVDVAGGDGVLDLTDYFGEPKFNNRPLQFSFKKVYNSLADFAEDWSIIQNDLNGQRMNIVLDDDSDFHYIGRITVDYSKAKNIVTYTMSVDAEPYKLKNDETVVTQTGNGTVTLNNLRKKCVPTVITTGETQITKGSSVYNLSEGEFVIPELELSAGANTLSVVASGLTTFKYQEGGL